MRNPLEPRSRKSRLALTGAAVAALIAIPAGVAAASTTSPARPATSHPSSAPKPTVVIEHGAWADGSSWDGVVARLQQDGYTVDVPPNPLRGESDPAYLASYLASSSTSTPTSPPRVTPSTASTPSSREASSPRPP
jgi:hypothetical protein